MSGTGVVGRDVERRVAAAVATVADPEFPGVSVVELGLLESIRVDPDGHVRVSLLPTFSGCPALSMIGDDVARAVEAVDGVHRVEVVWLAAPLWTTERISPSARLRLAQEFTVVVGAAAPCPVCAGGPLELVSDVGPTRCRAVRRCAACGEVVEQVRT
ncbi:MAG TPA: iron-sulfur cluster assembly protein [Ilumatobacteraceae bacterium]